MPDRHRINRLVNQEAGGLKALRAEVLASNCHEFLKVLSPLRRNMSPLPARWGTGHESALCLSAERRWTARPIAQHNCLHVAFTPGNQVAGDLRANPASVNTSVRPTVRCQPHIGPVAGCGFLAERSVAHRIQPKPAPEAV